MLFRSRFLVALLGTQFVTSGKHVAGIDAGPGTFRGVDGFEQVAQFLEGTAHRRATTGGIFEQDAGFDVGDPIEAFAHPGRDPLDGCLDSTTDMGSWMHHQEIETEQLGEFDLVCEGIERDVEQ